MSENIEQIRQKALVLAERVKTDASFRAQVEKDPEATLVAAGLPQQVIPEFLSETQLGEVSSYCGITCIGTSSV